jgi:hypothetical protein
MTMNQKSTANTSKQKKEEEGGGGKACRCFQIVKQLVSYHF